MSRIPQTIKRRTLEAMMDWAASANHSRLIRSVDRLKQRYPDLPPRFLAEKLLKRRAFVNGLVGAAAGIGGWFTMPLTLPADYIASLRLQATMAYTIAYLYGYTADQTDLKTDLYMILAGDKASAWLRQAGISATKALTLQAAAVIWRVLGDRIIQRLGERAVASLARGVPVAGAPFGFAADWLAARAVGRRAIRYYENKIIEEA